jgi:ferric-dicitrate binding protein FerR (iron transport regulator)
VKHLLGEASTEEQAEVNRWLEHDPANLAYYRQLEKIWVASRELAATSTVDENKAWKNFQQRITNQNNQTTAVAPVRSIKPWMKIAAAIVLLIGLGWIGFVFLNDKTTQQTVASAQTILVDTLPDGSVVTLNKQSEISYPSKFKGRSRPVQLKGEAFFSVAADKSKPFIITVGEVEVRVVGTSFNIKSHNGTTEVIVETGIVQVKTPDGSINQLTAGEMLKVETSQKMEKEPAAKELTNYYRPREFNCDDTPLWKLVDAMNQAYDTTIVIENQALRNLLIDGYFPNKHVSEIIDKIISANVNNVTITPQVKGDTIILK